jgi:ribosomal protein L21E
MKNVKEENVKYTEKENRSMLTEEKKERKLGDISQSLQAYSYGGLINLYI